MKFPLFIFLVCCLIISCKSNGNDPEPDPLRYQECDPLLYEPCPNAVGDYCLFGYKWGEDNPMIQSGTNAIGPQTSAATITYSFQPAGITFSSHSDTDITSDSFDAFPACFKKTIRAALSEWEQIADIRFAEEPEGSDSQIRFITADVRQTGIGFPNFPTSPCSDIGGDIILATKNRSFPCDDGIYPLALHEIGHALGLGHVQSHNIMSTRFWDDDILQLQSGDSAGIIQIYGVRPD